MAGAAFLFVGSLNRRLPSFPTANGRGIAVYAFDAGSGECRPLLLTEDIDNPSYLSVDPRRSCLYATSEVPGHGQGTVAAFRFDPVGGRLRYVSQQPTLGSIAAHNSLSHDGRFLLVANYGEGSVDERLDQSVAIFPIRADGGLDPACSSIAHQGRGPDSIRQERPHAHCAISSPDGRTVLVADLGIDAVLCHGLSANGSLTRDREPFRLTPGCGPRQIVCHPARPFVYVINELNSTIAALRFESGRLRLIETVSTIPETFRGENHSADLQVGPDGRFLYGSNRGHDSIVAYVIDAETGRLTRVGHYPSGGKTPRSFAIDPTGQWLLAANQNSDAVAVFRVDPVSGTLSDTGCRLGVGTPMCLKFLADSGMRP